MVVIQLKFAERTQFSLVLSMWLRAVARCTLGRDCCASWAARIGATVGRLTPRPSRTLNETMAAVLSVGIGALPSLHKKRSQLREPYRILLFMRQVSMLLPSPVTLVGTLVRAPKNVANFVTSSDCALAAKMMSLSCSCT